MQQYEPKATNYASLAAGVVSTDADCVLLAALTEDPAALITRQIAAALPQALIFGSSGLAESTYADPALGGIPLSLDSRVLITDAALSQGSYPASARQFFDEYERRHGDPQPSAILGYEAMSLMLDAISRATDRGKAPAVRSKVVSAIFATCDRHGVLGTYGIDANGDTTLDTYGVYRIVDGQLRSLKAMNG
jgi:branched-chain amino acid transport system substrate-binding protein